MLGRRMEESKSESVLSKERWEEKRTVRGARRGDVGPRGNIAKLTTEIRRLSVLLRLATCKVEA